MADGLSQAALDKIKDQVYAKITPALNDIISDVLANALANIPQPTPTPVPDPSPTPPSPPSTTTPDIGIAQWIWTQERPYDQPPGGPRAFRKVAVIPAGQLVDSMIIDVTCENYYTLYVNGCVVGSTTVVGDAEEWKVVKRYSIIFPPTDRVVIAVYAANDTVLRAQAGLIASAVVWNSTNDQGRVFKLRADASWLTSITATASGFQRYDYTPDSSWTSARVAGPYGAGPWGPIAKPTITSPVTEGFSGITDSEIADPPSAPLAVPGPDADGNTFL